MCIFVGIFIYRIFPSSNVHFRTFQILADIGADLSSASAHYVQGVEVRGRASSKSRRWFYWRRGTTKREPYNKITLNHIFREIDEPMLPVVNSKK